MATVKEGQILLTSWGFARSSGGGGGGEGGTPHNAMTSRLHLKAGFLFPTPETILWDMKVQEFHYLKHMKEYGNRSHTIQGLSAKQTNLMIVLLCIVRRSN